MRVITSTFWMLLLLSPLVTGALFQSPTAASRESPADCSQSNNIREALMKQAEAMRFTLRKVTFIGTTYTHDEVIRQKMREFNEGDLFSRTLLIKSLNNISTLRNQIYPVKLKNVEIEMNESAQTVDLVICFKQKPKRD